MTRACLYHPERAARRRGLCWTCVSKFRRAGVRYPVAMEAPGPRPWTPGELLASWAASLAPELRAALHAASAPAGPAPAPEVPDAA